MKRLLTFFMATILLIMMLASCEKPHVHTFDNWATVQEATCTDEGYEKRQCDCGSYETQNIAAKGHTVENGTCAACKEIIDPYQALVHYIVENGEVNGSARMLRKSKTDAGYYMGIIISYDTESKELTFMGYDDAGNNETVYAGFVFNTTGKDQKVMMSWPVNGTEYPISAHFNIATFDPQSPVLTSMEGQVPSALVNTLKSLFPVMTVSVLENASQLLKETGTGITMKMLGFEKIS